MKYGVLLAAILVTVGLSMTGSYFDLIFHFTHFFYRQLDLSLELLTKFVYLFLSFTRFLEPRFVQLQREHIRHINLVSTDAKCFIHVRGGPSRTGTTSAFHRSLTRPQMSREKVSETTKVTGKHEPLCPK